MNSIELELADWRRRVNALYGAVRKNADPARGHQTWRVGRDELFLSHPQSPLPTDHPFRSTGLPYWPYDGDLRFELPLLPIPPAKQHVIKSDNDEATTLRAIGTVEVPGPFESVLTLWRAEQYGGGLWLPIRDQTAGRTSYGGGRYLLDTVKGADLGGTHTTLVIDFNFLYHPSCCYSDRWKCPLAPEDNTVAVALCAGERLI